ncbi:MAG TPA: iron ABC transporter permease [Chromatiales bacterium]|nr:iron ABC transporter permease [Thiotrichales bacterium]HIP68712.1 iron ABC transporter permease [Chromatiales bacterium]
MPFQKIKHSQWLLPLLLSSLIATIFLAVSVGVVPLEIKQITAALLDGAGLSSSIEYSPQQAIILFDIRLPRVLLGAVIGGGLGISGAAIQGIFRNPLAEPSLIGVSAGAALAAAFTMVVTSQLVTAHFWLLPIAAFVGGGLVTWLVYQIAARSSTATTGTLLLAGIAINAMAGAGLGLLSYLADAQQLRNLVFWTLGGLDAANWNSLGLTGLCVFAAAFGLIRLARALNIFSLGEAEAGHLGLSSSRLKKQVVVLVALAVGASVAVAGIIGFIGLVVPHLVRLIIGPDHRLLLPASALLGAILLVLADMAARLMIAPAELPVGILTALLGAPFFLFLLLRQKQRL